MCLTDKIRQLCVAAALTFAACVPLAATASAQSLEGAWLISISADGIPSPFAIDMAVFESKGSYRIIPSNKGESEGAGAYVRTGSHEFRTTHTQVLYDAQGNFAGVAKVVAILTLGQSADVLTGRYRVVFLDAAANPQPDVVTGTIAGRLVVAEPL